MHNYKKRVLVMCLDDPSTNPRPLRAIELCRSQGYSVSAMGYPPCKELDVDDFFPLPVPSLSLAGKIRRKLYSLAGALSPFEALKLFWEGLRYETSTAGALLQGKAFDATIVEDLFLLPLAQSLGNCGKVLFDAREYYPRQNEGELWFDLFDGPRRKQLCSRYMTRCDAVVTVSEGLRREYLKKFGVATELYRSTPPYFDLPVRRTGPKRIRMVYHGAANRNRRLENLIKVASLLDDRFSLDLVLAGNPRYRQELMRKATGMARIGFPEPISFDKVVPAIAEYDIGFFYYEPTGFNIAHCLPNKFFEYIQARLMIAIGPSPDMAELVNQYGCGVVAEEFSIQSMAKALNSLTAEDIDGRKRNSDRAARELCFEKESEKMIAILDRLMG